MARSVSKALSKRGLIQAGTPIYDSVVFDLNFDPAAPWVEPIAVVTPKAVAKRVSRKTPKNPKVSA